MERRHREVPPEISRELSAVLSIARPDRRADELARGRDLRVGWPSLLGGRTESGLELVNVASADLLDAELGHKLHDAAAGITHGQSLAR